MKKNAWEFLRRGAIFGGSGPIVVGIIYFILEMTLENFSLSGKEVFLAIISTYLLAFIHAGASIFNQIEHWSLAKGMFWHLFTLYGAYTVCYLINSWIPFDWRVLLIYTAVFIAIYAVVWLVVLLCMRITKNKLNKQIKKP